MTEGISFWLLAGGLMLPLLLRIYLEELPNVPSENRE